MNESTEEFLESVKDLTAQQRREMADILEREAEILRQSADRMEEPPQWSFSFGD